MGASEATRVAAQITHRDTELFPDKAKIQALVLELAHLRRMRFGARSEALSAEQRDLFQETLASDSAAAVAELARQHHRRFASVPDANPCPSIEHRHDPEACTCGQYGKDLVQDR